MVERQGFEAMPLAPWVTLGRVLEGFYIGSPSVKWRQMTLNQTTRGYFEAKLFNGSKALQAYSSELSRKACMLHKPITQAYAIRNDNKLSLYMCRRQVWNINDVRGFCWCCFSQCQMCCLCLRTKAGQWEFIWKSKATQIFIYVLQWELQLTMSRAGNLHHQLCRDKADTVNPYLAFGGPRQRCPHVRFFDTRLKKLTPRVSFPEGKCLILV